MTGKHGDIQDILLTGRSYKAILQFFVHFSCWTPEDANGSARKPPDGEK
jgi:hypothetical protein